MKDRWPGIDASDSEVGGDDALDAENVNFSIERQLGRRAGQQKFCAAGGRSAAFLRGSAGGNFLCISKTDGTLATVNLLSPGTINSIYASYNTDVNVTMLAINGRMYAANGWDRLLVWNGVDSTFREAGIVAPSAAPGTPTATAGNMTAGTHLFRYRYLDNTSPASSYRSNASLGLSYTVATASSGNITFSIGTAATNIIRSADAKVTTIQLEATLADGTIYFVGSTVDNTATSISLNLSDATLALQPLAAIYDSGNKLDTQDFGTGNERPPLGTIIAQVRDVTFIGGDSPRTITATFTNGSTGITGTGFSPNWGNQQVIRGGTDNKSYQIASATATTITLVNAYTGVSGSKSSVVTAQNPNRIYWSAILNSSDGFGTAMPESWRLAARARDMLCGSGDTVRGLAEFNGDLIVAGLFTLQRVVWVDNVGLGEPDNLSGQFGVYNQRCLVSTDGQLFGLGPNGAWVCQGGAPRWISRPIDKLFFGDDQTAALVDETYAARFHGEYDPPTKSVRWFYVEAGETTVRQAIAMDLPGERWTREGYRGDVDASLYGADANGHLQSYLLDATGGFTFTREGATDGVPTGTGAYTGSTGSTPTVTNVVDSLPTGSALTDLSGLMIYRPGTSEEVRIASNTSSAITHATFATAVANGETLYVGSIPWLWSTGWWVGSGMNQGKRPALFIECQPGAVGGTAIVQFFQDWSATPVVWTGESTYSPPLGISCIPGNNYMTIEFGSVVLTNGFLKLPMTLDWNESVRAEVRIVTTTGELKFLDIYHALQSKADSQSKTATQ